MPTATRHQTKTEIALHSLRAKLASGSLRPGDRLRLRELVEEFGMSPTPIREALRLLQADGLVTYLPHHAMVVADLRVRDTADLVRLRCLLEGFATERSTELLNAAEVERLRKIHFRLLAAADNKRGTAVASLNSDWHWMIYNAAGSEALAAFIRKLWDDYPWRTMWALPGRLDDSTAEHTLVMNAVEARNPAAAAAAMRAHIASGESALTMAQ